MVRIRSGRNVPAEKMSEALFAAASAGSAPDGAVVTKLTIVLPGDHKNILLFGGSFDPPHVAHLILPMLAMEAIGADVIAYIPNAISPHKVGSPPAATAAHRLAMLRLMLADLPFARVLSLEIERHAAAPGVPSYTVDTLEQLRAQWGGDVTLRLLIGADQLQSFDRWHQPQRIIELAEPAVMVRPPHTRASVLAALPAGFEPGQWASRLVDLPVMELSATGIRQRVAQGKPIAGFVVPVVEDYIRAQRLYQG